MMARHWLYGVAQSWQLKAGPNGQFFSHTQHCYAFAAHHCMCETGLFSKLKPSLDKFFVRPTVRTAESATCYCCRSVFSNSVIRCEFAHMLDSSLPNKVLWSIIAIKIVGHGFCLTLYGAGHFDERQVRPFIDNTKRKVAYELIVWWSWLVNIRSPLTSGDCCKRLGALKTPIVAQDMRMNFGFNQ